MLETTIAMFPKARFDEMLKAAKTFNPASPGDAKWHFDQVHGGKLDTAESVFFARQLEALRPGILEVQYPELKGARLVPVDTNIAPGAMTWTYRVFDHVGSALVTSDLSTAIPRADIKGSESTQVIRSVVNAYGYSILENRAAMMAKTPLVPQRAMAARDIIERTLDNVIFLGDPVMGLKGLLNQSGVVTYTVANGASGSQSWSTKTPDEIIADMNGIVNKIVSDSLEIEQPDTLLLPLSAYTYISAKRMGDADPNTILSHFLRNSPYIKSVEATHKSESNSAWTGKRMVCYRRDPNKLAALMPQPFEQFPPQAEGFELVTNCHARTGGVVVMYPKSIAYGDGI